MAAVLMAAWMSACVAGTILETTRGAEYAAWAVYGAWWFKLILWLLAVNVFTALVWRYPYRRGQAGFVISHLSILLVLTAALITDLFSVTGQVRLPEGSTATHFANPRQETLTFLRPNEAAGVEIELTPTVFGRPVAAQRPMPEIVTTDGLRLEVLSYLPDSTLEERLSNDAPRPRAGVEVLLTSPEGREMPGHAIEDEGGRVGPVPVAIRRATDREQLDRLLGLTTAGGPSPTDRVRVEIASRPYEIPLTEALRETVPIGETGYALRVLRYLPHAEVADDGAIRNRSDLPANPFAEVDLSGPAGNDRRLLFARFPEFDDPPGGEGPTERPRLMLLVEDLTPRAMIEVLLGPAELLHVRFLRDAASWNSHEVSPGKALPFPLEGWTFTVRRVFDHARVERLVQPVDPPRTDRTPAIRLRITEQDCPPQEMWVQKYLSERIELTRGPLEVAYADQFLPLGFSLTLERSCVVNYPGEDRPRSYESRVLVSDSTGRPGKPQVISMNRPLKHGGWSVFQLGTAVNEEGAASATLGVSRDPGRWIAFAGYFGLVIGMMLTIGGRRVCGREEKKTAARPPPPGGWL